MKDLATDENGRIRSPNETSIRTQMGMEKERSQRTLGNRNASSRRGVSGESCGCPLQKKMELFNECDR